MNEREAARAALDTAPRWVLEEERQIAAALVREIQCHAPRSSACRICQLLDRWDRLNPVRGRDRMTFDGSSTEIERITREEAAERAHKQALRETYIAGPFGESTEDVPVDKKA